MSEQIKNTGKDKKTLLLFLAGWITLNLLQAAFTELAHDEAYYWVWSRAIDWGYIEHPPMVALFIKIGYALIPNEIGVRLMAIVFSALILYQVYIQLIMKDIWLYVAMVSSMLLFHIGGFFTAPDTPLFVFVGLYYLFLKEYLEKNTWQSTLVMTLIITAMMYSKYHGVLVLFFTILFNWRLLTRKTFWIIAITSALLFLPHVYWLFTEGKPGLEYALSGRFRDPLSFYQVFINFLLGQIAIAGPLIGIIVLYAAFAVKPTNPYQRTLKPIMIGILGFFFIWSFKGRTESNWTASAFIPMLVLAHQYISERKKLRKVVLWLAIPSVLIILAVRLQLMFYYVELPHRVDRHGEFDGWKEYAAQINKLAEGVPVITSGYQSASKLWFYGGKTTYAIHNPKRPSQFDLMNYGETLYDKKVLILMNYLLKSAGEIPTPLGTITYQWFDEYRDYTSVRLEPLVENNTYEAGTWVNFRIRIFPNEKWSIPASNETQNPAFITHIMREENGDGGFWNQYGVVIENEISHPEVVTTKVLMPDKPGEYKLWFVLANQDITIWRLLTDPVSIKVTEANKP